jgi:hypothetical protein
MMQIFALGRQTPSSAFAAVLAAGSGAGDVRSGQFRPMIQLAQ